MQDKRLNAGDEIIKSLSVDKTEFVLDENIHDRAEAEVAFERSIGECPKENETKKKKNRDGDEAR